MRGRRERASSSRKMKRRRMRTRTRTEDEDEAQVLTSCGTGEGGYDNGKGGYDSGKGRYDYGKGGYDYGKGGYDYGKDSYGKDQSKSKSGSSCEPYGKGGKDQSKSKSGWHTLQRLKDEFEAGDKAKICRQQLRERLLVRCFTTSHTLQMLTDKFEARDKAKIDTAVAATLDWLEKEQRGMEVNTVLMFVSKQAELEDVVNPIMMKVLLSFPCRGWLSPKTGRATAGQVVKTMTAGQVVKTMTEVPPEKNDPVVGSPGEQRSGPARPLLQHH